MEMEVLNRAIGIKKQISDLESIYVKINTRIATEILSTCPLSYAEDLRREINSALDNFYADKIDTLKQQLKEL